MDESWSRLDWVSIWFASYVHQDHILQVPQSPQRWESLLDLQDHQDWRVLGSPKETQISALYLVVLSSPALSFHPWLIFSKRFIYSHLFSSLVCQTLSWAAWNADIAPRAGQLGTCYQVLSWTRICWHWLLMNCKKQLPRCTLSDFNVRRKIGEQIWVTMFYKDWFICYWSEFLWFSILCTWQKICYWQTLGKEWPYGLGNLVVCLGSWVTINRYCLALKGSLKMPNKIKYTRHEHQQTHTIFCTKYGLLLFFSSIWTYNFKDFLVDGWTFGWLGGLWGDLR